MPRAEARSWFGVEPATAIEVRGTSVEPCQNRVAVPLNDSGRDVDTRLVPADGKRKQQAYAVKSLMSFAVWNAIILTYAGFVIFRDVLVALALGICAGVLSGYLWRPGGLFARWTHDVSDDA
jgi:hypothetical protein